jgi:phage protein D
MFKPAYKLTIGNQTIDTTNDPQTSTLVDLTVSLNMNVPADSFTLIFGQVGGISPDRLDDTSIELGYADPNSLTQVITGKVARVEPTLTHHRVIGYSAAATLLQTFVNQTYQNKTAGEIIRDLADRAAVPVAIADPGIRFPAYVIEASRSIYPQMDAIATLCGFDLYINSAGQLVCQRFNGGNTVHVFTYAQNILELEMSQTEPRATQVEVWGESAGSSQGENSWAWLTKDFSRSRGIAGTGNPKLLLAKPVLRTAAAARTVAQTTLTTLQRQSQRGRLRVLGAPQVKLGDAIRLQKVPETALNDTFQVRGVSHRLNKQTGFTTTIEFSSLA